MCLRLMVDLVQSLHIRVTAVIMGRLFQTLVGCHVIKNLSCAFIKFTFDVIFRLCAVHSRKEELKRQKSSLRHFPSPSTESLLTGLSHYVPTVSSQISNIAVKEESSDEPLDPFCKLSGQDHRTPTKLQSNL